MDEFIKSLNLGLDGEYINGVYQVELLDSDEYQQVWYALDETPDLEIDESKLLMSESTNYIVYDTSKFEVTLIGDFDKDTYRMEIKEK